MNKRIEILYSLVPKCNIVADIGCDHGLLVNKLSQSDKVKSVVGSEISVESLNKAKSNFSSNVAKNPTQFILSDGLKSFGDIVPDCLVIAGMGGCEMIKILSDYSNLEKVKYLILQPMKDQAKLRMFLEKEFLICKDFVVNIKKKFYTFILAEKGNDCLTEEQILYGKTNFYDSPLDFKEYLDYNIEMIMSYLDNAKDYEIRKKLLNNAKVLISLKEKYYGKNACIPKS